MPNIDALHLRAEHWQQIAGHLSACLPEEACGLIAGSGDTTDLVIPVENRLHSAARFQMDPQEQWQAFRAIEEHGYNLLAIYHSHPQGPQEPSETDLEEFAYPGVISIICVPSDGSWWARAYFSEHGGYNEVTLSVLYR